LAGCRKVIVRVCEGRERDEVSLRRSGMIQFRLQV
jgi:hypothetical protein